MTSLGHKELTERPMSAAKISFCYNVTFIAVNQVNVITFYPLHYDDVIMGSVAAHITSLAIVYPTVYSDTDQRKHQSSVSVAFVRGILRWPVNSSYKGPVTRKMFAFDDVIMIRCKICWLPHISQLTRLQNLMFKPWKLLHSLDYCDSAHGHMKQYR